MAEYVGYMRSYHVFVSGDQEEGWLASVADLPGCITAGETMGEALELLKDAMEGWLESARARGLPIPEPSS